MDKQVFVDLPSKRISRKKQKNGTTYIYYRTNFRRNERGKATFDETAIGKLDEGSGKLIPNRNYYEVYLGESVDHVRSVKTLGLTFVLNRIVRDLKLDKIMSPIFESTQELLALAYYVLARGNVVVYAQDWIEGNAWTQSAPCLYSSKIGRLFENISYEQRLDFFERWAKQQTQREYWYYDVASVSSYGRQIDFLEWGYDREGEPLPQLNVGLCYGAVTQLPLFYRAYNGSITDKTYFTFLLQDFPFLDSDFPIYLITDQGFITRDNLQTTGQESKRFRVLSSLPLYLKDAQRILSDYGPSVKQDAHYLREEHVYGRRIVDTVLDQSVNIYLYYDIEKAAYDTKLFYESLLRTETELQALKRSQLNSERYRQYFKIDVTNEQSFTYERDSKAIDDYLKTCGYYVLLSTGPDLSPSEALRRYRQKDLIVEQFYQLKNEIDYLELKTHNRKTTEGKLFIGFIALILRSYLLNLLKSLPDKIRPSISKLIIELEKIKVIETKGGKRSLTPLTKKQKEILEALNISEDELGKVA
ncbi:MAG: transposase [Thermoguttaceae bacterium]|jgi:transposase|nr:transposase [Thermoguttaceae bacterium]